MHREVIRSGLEALAAKQQQVDPQFYLSFIRPNNPLVFTTHITTIIKEVEKTVLEHSSHTTLESLSQESAHLRVKVYQGLKKSMMVVVAAAASPAACGFHSIAVGKSSSAGANDGGAPPVRVCLYNFFESFSAQGKKLKERGEGSIN